MSSNDPWTWWRRALAGEQQSVVEDDPQPGYWRARNDKGSAWTPVVFWYGSKDGALRCLHGTAAITDLGRMSWLWQRACQNPISTATYKRWEEDGSWPDVDAAVAEQIGGSNTADVPEEVLLADQIESALAGLSGYRSVDSDEKAAAAQSLRARLLELKGQAEKAHKVEKAPWLEGGRKVDATWLPLAKSADVGATQLRGAIKGWEDAKLRKQRAEEAAQRQAEIEAAEEHALPEPELPEPEPLRGQVKGGYGAAASVRSAMVVTGFADQDKVYAFFRDDSDLRNLLMKLAQKAVKAGIEVPGATIEEQAVVR